MKVLRNSNIWDLHIHTNKCPRGTGEFVKEYGENTEGFIDKLISIFDKPKHKLLSMISFTDHNYISYEVYREYLKRGHKVKLIPGVEIDFIKTESNVKKHLVAYFDVETITEIKELSIKINDLLKETRENNNPMEITKLLSKLLRLDYNFLISPHAFKQGKRGINSDWTESMYTKEDSKLYMDQFFLFWEASGHSSVSIGADFLKDFELKEKISIVKFSDADNFKKIEEHLSNPLYYYNSLSTFKGLALVGSDATRIRKNYKTIEKSDYSNVIGKIIFNNQEIKLSNQLNTIIGGRGSGKSILLDSMANRLGEEIINKNRNKYLENFDVRLFDLNGKEISESFNVEYYNQAYITDIFSSTDFSDKLQSKFSEAFNKIDDVDVNAIMNNLQTRFNNSKTIEAKDETENLKGLTNSFPIIDNDGLDINIYKNMRMNVLKRDEIIDYDDALSNIDKNLKNVIPQQILDNDKIMVLKNIIEYFVLRESKNYNEGLIRRELSNNVLIDTFHVYKDNKSTIAKEKSEHSSAIKNNLRDLSLDYVNRSRVVQAILTLTQDFKRKYNNYLPFDGDRSNRFIFSKELTIETPIDFFLSCLDEFFDNNKLSGSKLKIDEEHIIELFYAFIYKPNDYIKESKNLEGLVIKLNSFSLNNKLENKIYYVDDDEKIKDITTLSPGYQTNILMEYIVTKNTAMPLLIDQPEDNVDNHTVYQKLRKWFVDLKFKRQVIVVTHDANIVINSDAENVIVANQVKENEFDYKSGALEYEDIINKAAEILDGGEVAVRRRLAKYDSGNN